MKRVKKKTLDFMSRHIVDYLDNNLHGEEESDPLAVTSTLAAMQACLVEAYSEHLGEDDAAKFYYGIADELAIKANPVTRFKNFKN